MKLKLHRPLVTFDLETTGVVVGLDRIVELGVLKVLPDGTQSVKVWRINPEMSIPAAASRVHGIYDADVADCPTFKDVAADIKQYLTNVDLAGYNSNRFDVPMLVDEFLRAGVEFDIRNHKLIDVQHIYHKMPNLVLFQQHINFIARANLPMLIVPKAILELRMQYLKHNSKNMTSF